jgi:hypothetical protein
MAVLGDLNLGSLSLPAYAMQNFCDSRSYLTARSPIESSRRAESISHLFIAQRHFSALIGGGDLAGRLGGCVIALEEEKSATSACIQSKYESNTPDGAPYRVKQEGSATTRNSTEDSRQRGKLLRYCPGRKKVSDQCVH